MQIENFLTPTGDRFSATIENELPFLILTPNLVIRPLLKEDKTLILEALRDNLRILHMWLPWADKAPEAKEFASVGEKFYAESESNVSIHYVVYKDNKLIGMCSLGNYNDAHASARLGFWCNAESDNNEVFVEAINGMLQYTFNHTSIKSVYIPCVVGNFASEKYAKELHFKLLSIEIISGIQIKIFKINGIESLPKLDLHFVKNENVAVKNQR